MSIEKSLICATSESLNDGVGLGGMHVSRS